jgi:hypothetical protein
MPPDERSMSEVYRAYLIAQGEDPDELAERKVHVPSSWKEVIARWAWVRRADAFDDALRQRSEELEEKRRWEATNRRRVIIDRSLGAVAQAVTNAELETLDAKEARSLLAVLARLLKDMLEQDRIESGVHKWRMDKDAVQDERKAVASLDTVVSALAELERWQKGEPPAEAQP